VVLTILKNMSSSVGKDYPQYIMGKKCSKPPDIDEPSAASLQAPSSPLQSLPPAPAASATASA